MISHSEFSGNSLDQGPCLPWNIRRRSSRVLRGSLSVAPLEIRTACELEHHHHLKGLLLFSSNPGLDFPYFSQLRCLFFLEAIIDLLNGNKKRNIMKRLMAVLNSDQASPWGWSSSSIDEESHPYGMDSPKNGMDYHKHP